MICNKKNIIIGIAILLCIVIFYFLFKNPSDNVSVKQKNIVAKAIETDLLPIDTTNFSTEDKKAFDELTKWVPVIITNQPTISDKPQTINLPVGWTAREDYLLSVVPESLPGNIRNYRSVIIRSPNSKNKYEAIYNIPDMSNSYFKNRCNLSKTITCYGGENKEIKRVFDLMFYFNK
jgi:hypothetical protein